jgi:hypothetical protein
MRRCPAVAAPVFWACVDAPIQIVVAKIPSLAGNDRLATPRALEHSRRNPRLEPLPQRLMRRPVAPLRSRKAPRAHRRSLEVSKGPPNWQERRKTASRRGIADWRGVGVLSPSRKSPCPWRPEWSCASVGAALRVCGVRVGWLDLGAEPGRAEPAASAPPVPGTSMRQRIKAV